MSGGIVERPGLQREQYLQLYQRLLPRLQQELRLALLEELDELDVEEVLDELDVGVEHVQVAQSFLQPGTLAIVAALERIQSVDLQSDLILESQLDFELFLVVDVDFEDLYLLSSRAEFVLEFFSNIFKFVLDRFEVVFEFASVLRSLFDVVFAVVDESFERADGFLLTQLLPSLLRRRSS